MLVRGSQRGFSCSVSFCPVNPCDWRINILWKWGLTCYPHSLLLPGRSLQGQERAPEWGNPMEKQAELRPSWKDVPPWPLACTAAEQLSNEQPAKAQTAALSPSLPFQKRSPKWELQLTESRLKKSQPSTPEEAAPGGPAPWAGRREATKPPARISSRCLLFTNLRFTPPCSKHK